MTIPSLAESNKIQKQLYEISGCIEKLINTETLLLNQSTNHMTLPISQHRLTNVQ